MARLIRSATEPATRALAMLLALTLALGPAVAHADPAAETKAKALYKDGMKAYDVGDFDTALGLYSEAFKLTQLPGFLFNIAQCHRQLGNFERAAFFYGRFIDNSKPAASNVELATQLLTEMKEKQAAERKRAEDTARAADEARSAAEKADAPRVTSLVPNPLELPPPPPPPAPEEPPVYKRWWFWTMVGVGVAAIATGAAVGVSASQTKDPNFTTQPPIGTPH